MVKPMIAAMLVGTHYMPADIFTKALDKSTFVRLRGVLMNTNGSFREPLFVTLFQALESMHGEARRLASRLLGRF